MAGGVSPAAVRSALASPVVQAHPPINMRGVLSPSPGQSGSLGLAHERLNLSIIGLLLRVIETIQNVLCV